VLGRSNVKLTTGDFAEEHILTTEAEFPLHKTHGRTSIATAAGLMKNEFPVLLAQQLDQFHGGGCGGYALHGQIVLKES
jgi:hypothetical protein